jgi:hypothetical protein
MVMTQVMADASGKVQPEVTNEHAAADRVEIAVRLIIDRGRTVAAAAEDVKSALAEEGT